MEAYLIKKNAYAAGTYAVKIAAGHVARCSYLIIPGPTQEYFTP